MKYLLLIMTTIGLNACIGAGENSTITPRGDFQIPAMTGIDLTGEERPIPQSLEGDLNILIFAFEREQQQNVNTWLPAVKDMEQSYESVRFYEIPLIYEMNALMRGWVNNGMRSGIEGQQARERTITVYTERDRFLNMMDMASDTIYTLLVDQDGTILWRIAGDATDQKITALQSAIEKNL